MPPAARMPSAPSGGFGMPSARCDRPHAAKVSAMVPTTMRLVVASSWGARSMRRPRAIRTSGTAYATRPKVPAKTACTTSPKVPETPHHSRAATTTASAMRAKPMPSRRCSGSRSAALWPTRRTAPPARCETPIHVLRIAPSGKGRPPPRALDAVLAAGLRAAGLRCAGRVDRAAGGRDVAPPEDPLARVAAVVLERWLLDGRDAMVAPYVNALLNSRVTRATPAVGLLRSSGAAHTSRHLPYAVSAPPRGPPCGRGSYAVSDRDILVSTGGQRAGAAPIVLARS